MDIGWLYGYKWQKVNHSWSCWGAKVSLFGVPKTQGYRRLLKWICRMRTFYGEVVWIPETRSSQDLGLILLVENKWARTPSSWVVFKITMKEFYFHQKWYLSLSNNYILLLNLCLTPINLRLIVCNNYLLCLFDVLLSVVSCICLKKEVKIRNIVKEVQNLLKNLKTRSLFSSPTIKIIRFQTCLSLIWNELFCFTLNFSLSKVPFMRRNQLQYFACLNHLCLHKIFSG